MKTDDAAIDPLPDLLDTLVADPKARAAAHRELLRLRGSATARRRVDAMTAELRSPDPWISRARPSFLYVMYALLLWSIPMGVIAAVRPALARDMAAGMTAYLAGLPEPLYALFATGYLGYTVARSWGKAKGTDR